ncbi:hypothetical protein Tco_0740928 [Tanacetum coccineum]
MCPILCGDYTPREQEDIDDSLYVYGKYGPQPQCPSPTESATSSTAFSTCQSNDSDGELGAVTDHSVNDDQIPTPSTEQVTNATPKTQPQVSQPTQTVDPSCAQHVKPPRQPIRTPVTSSPIPLNNRQNWNQRMQRDLGHLIKNCDYYEKKMAREAALKSKRVVHTNDRQATPAWNNTNRINKANQFTPRPVNVRPNLSTASNTIKTGRVHKATQANEGLVPKEETNSFCGVQDQSTEALEHRGSKEVTDIDVQTDEDEDLLVVSSTSSKAVKLYLLDAHNEEEVSLMNDNDDMPEIRGIYVDVITNPTLRIHNAHPQSQSLDIPIQHVSTRSSLKKITEAHALVFKSSRTREGHLQISDKYVAETLKKIDLLHVKAANIHSMEPRCLLTKDEEAFDEMSIIIKIYDRHLSYSVGYTITEESVRRQLQLADDSGITMLQNEEIFEGLQNFGYLTDGTFTFWKSHFTPQWRFLIHHILHCISSKSGGWDQFGSNIATALICLSTGRVFNFSKLIFDGMISNLKSKSKFLMYPRFLQVILNIETEIKNLFVPVLLTKKIFGNMKRGFQGIHRPLLPAMLTLDAGQAQPSGASTPSQNVPTPTPPHVPLTTPPPVKTPTPSTLTPPLTQPVPSPIPPPIPTPISPPIPTPTPLPTSPPPPPPETEPTTDEHIYEEQTPVHHHLSPSQAQAPSHMTVDDLLQTVPKLISRIDSLEEDLKQTKLTMGNAIVKLVKKVKKLEGFIQRRNLVLTDSEEEEPEAQGTSVQGGYKRRGETKDKKVVSSLNFQEEFDAGAEKVSAVDKEVNTASGINTGRLNVNTGIEQESTVGENKGQREGKSPMLSEETPKKSKEQILQEEASLAEAIRLDTLQEEERAKQIHLDSLLAQRIAEEEQLTEQQMKRKAQLRKLSFEEVKEEFDKLVKQIESFVPMGFEATKENLKRFGEELQTKTSKRLKEEKDDEAKDVKPTKMSGKRKKQIARKGVHTSVDDSEDSDKVSEQKETAKGTETPINPVPVAMKTPSVATYKIIKPMRKSEYKSQIVREDGTDVVYINFGAMMKSISRDDLTELYRIVMKRYGMDGPEDKLEKEFWKYPMDVYMLSDRKYPLSAEMCQAMLKMKLIDGRMNEDCYRLLKMMEKQALGIKK